MSLIIQFNNPWALLQSVRVKTVYSFTFFQLYMHMQYPYKQHPSARGILCYKYNRGGMRHRIQSIFVEDILLNFSLQWKFEMCNDWHVLKSHYHSTKKWSNTSTKCVTLYSLIGQVVNQSCTTVCFCFFVCSQSLDVLGYVFVCSAIYCWCDHLDHQLLIHSRLSRSQTAMFTSGALQINGRHLDRQPACRIYCSLWNL